MYLKIHVTRYVMDADWLQACTGHESALVSEVAQSAQDIAAAREGDNSPTTAAPVPSPAATTAAVTTGPPGSAVSTGVWTYPGGWQMRVTITITGPVRPTNASQVDSLYTSAGGTAPAACFQNRASGALDSTAISFMNARVWVGTLKYELLSPVSNGWPSTQTTFDSIGRVIVGAGFTNSKACYFQAQIPSLQQSPNTAIPLVVVDYAAYSPANPNGVAFPDLGVRLPGTITSGPGTDGNQMPVTLPR